ncbi:MAG TPA: PH domain-containing protein [Acidimicrobiia bacterium]|nr:PH domain-containing protein [Acidimicrobiia bacterium]
MRERLRAARDAAAELAEKAQRLIPGGKSDVDDPSDDEDDDDLPAVDVADPAHADLARLDEEDAEPMAIDTNASLFDDLRAIDPTPPLPLTDVHEAGFAALVRGLDKVEGTGLTDSALVRRILDLVGDRLTLSVGPDGITVRGLVRRRHTSWNHVEHLTFAGRYDMLRSGYLTKIIDDIKTRLGLPIPGLSWLIRKVVNGIANWLEKKIFTAEEIDSLKETGGNALLAIQRRGRDIELSGPLLLVSIMAPGFSEAVEREARSRGLEVEVEAKSA